MSQPLTLDALKEAVVGHAAAFRRVVELQPVGGPGAKIFPPTYEGGRYATEKRRINGETVDCVLLDSVQSQANRMESALQEAWENGDISLPVIKVDFRDTVAPWAGEISSLQAPHRIADAILRDSLLGGVPFRQTAVGMRLNEVSLGNATALFEHCPTALVFGMWDSTGPRGGLGAKFARAIVSEIIGIGAVPGQRTSSRIDPLQIGISGNTIYATDAEDWTIDPQQASRDPKGNPVKYRKKGRPSEINHGNVTPSFAVQKDRNRNPVDKTGQPTKRTDEQIPVGGYTVDYARQTTIISLPALRRLRFPVEGKAGNEAAARTALAALALCAAALDGEKGYNLRSQCDLYAPRATAWDLLGQPGAELQSYALDAAGAVALFVQAVKEATEAGLPWNASASTLTPRADLAELVRRSFESGGSDEDSEEA